MKHLEEIIREKSEISFRFLLKINKDSKILFEIYCVDPSYGLKDLLKIEPYSIILTSGTLFIDSLECQLKHKFTQKLNNKHVIDNSQFLAHIISSVKIGNKKYKFSFNYEKRNDEKIILLLGEEIYNLVNAVKKGGVLVFFSSYEYLNKCKGIWEKGGVIEEFKKLNKIIIFDKEFNAEHSIEEGKKNKNLLLFTVHRGKNSEGINFPDDEARMVICIGIPFPKVTDIKVKLKMKYLDETYKKEKKGINGWSWYKREMKLIKKKKKV